MSFAMGLAIEGNTTMKSIVRIVIALPMILVAFGAFLGGTARAQRPNVVVILADDQGWGDLTLPRCS